MKAHFFHGFAVKDGGKNTTDKLIPYFKQQGFEIVEHDYGWVWLFRLRNRNKKVVEQALPQIEEGDVLVCHSNGCLIGWELIEAGAPAKAIICIQPALRKDTIWKAGVKVLCTYNDKDWVVNLGRMWGRLVSVANPFRDAHGWGAAGKYGFTSNQPHVYLWDLDVPPKPAPGHSTVFKDSPVSFWGPQLAEWGWTA